MPANHVCGLAPSAIRPCACRTEEPRKLSRGTHFPVTAFCWPGPLPGPRGPIAGLEPGPGGVGPCAAAGVRCTGRRGGGNREHGAALGSGGPHGGRGLAALLAGQFVRLGGKFPRRGGNGLVRSLVLRSSRFWCRIDDGAGSPRRHHGTAIVRSRRAWYAGEHPAGTRVPAERSRRIAYRFLTWPAARPPPA